jgi:hypothetical protein
MSTLSMRTLFAGAVALATVVAFNLVPASAQESPRQEGARDLTVSVSETAIAAFSGDRFTITSEITNNDSNDTPDLIATLAFVAVDGETYVDPEDWSPQRTLPIGIIEGRESATQTWTIKPALAGDVAAFVAVLPRDPELAAAGALAASPAINLKIEERRTLNPGGVLPVVLAVPAVLGLGFVGVRLSRRRR